jgi:hypothetical protein
LGHSDTMARLRVTTSINSAFFLIRTITPHPRPDYSL